MKNKILITGSNGFVGNSLVKSLSKDFNIIEFTRKSNIEDILKINPDYIIHTAAEIYNNDNMFKTNVVLTYELLEMCMKLGNLKNFVYIGSSSEYGRKNLPIVETDCLNPDSIYEGTKACGSLLTRSFGKTYGFTTSIVRPFSLYGPNEQERKYIPTLYNLFTNNIRARISNGNHDWIYIDDFIDGVKLVLFENKNSGDFFNFGTGIQTSNMDVFKIMSKLLKKTIEYDNVDSINRPDRIDSTSWVADISKVSNVFNWYPKITLEDGIQKYINYRKNGNN